MLNSSLIIQDFFGSGSETRIDFEKVVDHALELIRIEDGQSVEHSLLDFVIQFFQSMSSKGRGK